MSAAVRTCRQCGCTDDDCSQCIEAQGFPCTWVEADLCSRCAAAGAGPVVNLPGPRKGATFEQYLRARRLTPLPWQQWAAFNLLQSMYPYRGLAASGKRWLMTELADFVRQHGTDYELQLDTSGVCYAAVCHGCGHVIGAATMDSPADELAADVAAWIARGLWVQPMPLRQAAAMLEVCRCADQQGRAGER